MSPYCRTIRERAHRNVTKPSRAEAEHELERMVGTKRLLERWTELQRREPGVGQRACATSGQLLVPIADAVPEPAEARRGAR